ncbi:putative hydrolase of the HAD superfamily [Halanaerobium saccharolyticum]|uniref:Putative hydrolase of the HAD superfamily n=1 Tax=Halanaerobium saccharolyticum TaxID=43595 RepID=A0A4R7Z0A9_9FIRM|nr:HAD family phosphatase [Halanaerobium saccharolyticum]RAK08469.1 putative hydrolase of the HAD superfamily [Halanaerobium saccharolyticum]TDW03496.1 putative hydrolase of the HAD superfamily [Halanaerobium saccharolyticum]TDX59961.1 putative hydrolase of the HAD superfamily [Halanaerobium saccharolyticum]
MIRNIIFDLGNVLLNFDPDSYLKKLGYSGEIKDRLKAEIFETEEWLMLDRGTITQEQAVEKWQQRNLELEEEIADVMSEWEKMLTLKEDSLEILKNLAARDFNLYILSNFHQQAFEHVSSKYDFFNYFDGRVISADIGMIKPELEIYQHLLDKFNLKAEATLFIDDSQPNIKAALKKGIRVIHFTDAASLGAELKLYLRE